MLYQGETDKNGGSITGDDLARLGYRQGKVTGAGNHITYQQNGWGGFRYEVSVSWKKINATTIEGVWSISSNYAAENFNAAQAIVKKVMAGSYAQYFSSHARWWKNY